MPKNDVFDILSTKYSKLSLLVMLNIKIGVFEVDIQLPEVSRELFLQFSCTLSLWSCRREFEGGQKCSSLS